MSNFCANRIVRRAPSIGKFIALLTAAVLFVLPQMAYCQDEGPGTIQFAEPEQFDFSKPVIIKKHEPDIEKAKKYCTVS